MTDFLYPFIEADEREAAPLLEDLARSADAKAADSRELGARAVREAAAELTTVARAMADRFAVGGRLFTFGNGGSATDAAGLASLFVTAAGAQAIPLPARSLVADESVLTALANDIGFDVVFSRQLIAHANGGDIALGLSTSGNSENIIAAFEEAKRRELLTVGVAGYDGGAMAASAAVDHCLVVDSDSVHRIQEAQAAIAYRLWAAIQEELMRQEAT